MGPNTPPEKTQAPAETPVGAPPAGGRDLETGAAPPPEGRPGRLPPSARLTGHQLFYMAVLDGLGGMTLSAGVNFAIAYAMYTAQDTQANPIRLWQFPNTLAGDAAVTVFIQGILTWFVELALVAFDLSHRSVQPIGFVREPRRPWLRWLCLLPATTAGTSPPPSSSPPQQPQQSGAAKSWFLYLFHQLLRGFLLSVVGFVLVWPAAVGTMTVFGERTAWGARARGDWAYADRWAPQFFKFALGGVLGLLTTPVMAAFWLVKAGWEAQREDGS